MGQFLLLLIILLAKSNDAVSAINLEAAYQSALTQSQTIASQTRMVLIAEERYAQARGNILPNLALNGSYTIQDDPADPLAGTFFPTMQPELKLTVRQPIFQGLREFAALGLTQSNIKSEKHARENAVRLLYNDVAKSYHAVLATEEDFRNISDQLKTYDDRVSELNRRIREGTSRESDLLATQSSRATVLAQLKTAQASVSAARETFAFLTSLPYDTQIAAIEAAPPPPKLLEDYLKGIEQRPDVLQLIERAEGADAQTRIAKGAHAPSVNLIGNYYFKRQSDIYRGIDWDIQAALSFPLFAGGTLAAQTQESVLQRERAELELTRLRRLSQQQIRTLYSDYKSGLESIAALEESLRLAEKNSQFLKRDFGRGLSRNLDVLQAIVSENDIRRELLKTRFIIRDKWIELNTAAGQPPFNKGT